MRAALESVVALVATVALIALVHPEPPVLVLGGALALTLSRSRLVGSWRGRLEAAVALPVLALATAGIGALFLLWPPLGAAAFTGGMFLSVWLRRFGPTWHRIGSLVALPLVTLLIAPAGGGSILATVVVSLVALAVVVAVRLVFRTPAAEAPRASSAASTRLAVQLAVALAAAFVVGLVLLPEHWTWVVLSAYLVSAGNRGRADVLHKSGLRLVGAAAGTLAAVLLGLLPALEGPPLVVVVVAILSVGLLVRTLSYAWWALAVTLVVTLLQEAAGYGAGSVGIRLLAIAVGAALAVAAAWWVLPIRSESVLRRRIADVLAAADGYITRPDAPAPTLHAIEEVAPPFVALARVPLLPTPRAAAWIAALRDVMPLLPRDPELLPVLRAARRAVREPDELGAALDALRTAVGSGS